MVLKTSRLFILGLGVSPLISCAEEPSSQQNTTSLHRSENHAPTATKISETSSKEAPISSHISDAFNQTIRRNLNLLLNAKLTPENVEPSSDASYFQQKSKDQQTFISPTVGFRYQLTPRLSLSAETELGYFKLASEKWYDINYHPPDELLNDNTSVLFHTDAGIKFRF